ncbi:hypothetical protein M9H77_23697 [Catharanthus roseus]|uniref:Uncharacterized protein n=1 Tax=Catharanthus roseus TaxID=4058 RepID=A0ACC0AU03_CATRO|nr:hypothetical protein M9H77_23697 [Catharanthus roseus]
MNMSLYRIIASDLHSAGKMVFLFTNTNKKPFRSGVNSSYDLVFGSVRGLHCMWLVPRTRASSDGVDVSNSGEWIHLKRDVDSRGYGPIGLRGHRIMLCGGVRSPSGESGRARHRGWSQGRPGRCPKNL